MSNSNSDYYPMGVDGSHPHFNWPDAPRCLKCDMELDEEWHYCPHCGKKVDWAEIEAEEEAWRC